MTESNDAPVVQDQNVEDPSQNTPEVEQTRAPPLEDPKQDPPQVEQTPPNSLEEPSNPTETPTSDTQTTNPVQPLITVTPKPEPDKICLDDKITVTPKAKESRFKGKAPNPRKEGSVAERLAQRRSEQDQISSKRRQTWMLRLSLSCVALFAFYFAAGGILKDHFYLSLANPEDPNWFYWATDKLAERRTQRAVPVFITALRTSNPNRRLGYAALIKELAEPQHRDTILQHITSSDTQDRRSGLYAFYFLLDKKWLLGKDSEKLLLTTLANDEDERCRIYAAMIFAKKLPAFPNCRPGLVKAAEDPSPSVRRSVLEALSWTKEAVYADLFKKSLHDRAPEVRFLAALGLARIGDIQAVEALSNQYDVGDDWERREVIQALTEVQRPEATRLLIRAIEDAEPDIAAAAITLLENRPQKAIEPALVRALESTHVEARIASTKAIAARNITQAVPLLMKNLKNYDGWRELEALDESLQKLTKAKNIPPPGGQSKSRKAAVKAWLAWFEQHKN